MQMFNWAEFHLPKGVTLLNSLSDTEKVSNVAQSLHLHLHLAGAFIQSDLQMRTLEAIKLNQNSQVIIKLLTVNLNNILGVIWY